MWPGGDAFAPGAGFAPDAWAACVLELAGRLAPDAIVAAGSDRGNDVLARVAARIDQPFRGETVSRRRPARDGAAVVRIRWGGSLLEEAALHGSPALISVAPHAVAATPAAAPVETAVAGGSRRSRTRTCACARSSVSPRAAAGSRSSDARVVVSGGRGVGSSEASR